MQPQNAPDLLVRNTLAELPLSLAPPVLGHREGIFEILDHVRRDKKHRHASVFSEGDGLMALCHATDEVFELRTGGSDRDPSHVGRIPYSACRAQQSPPFR